jgi:hypothetical protein
LHAQFIEIKEILRKSQQFDDERKTQYKEYIDKLVSEITTISISINRNPSSPISGLNQIFYEFMKNLNDPADISYYNDKFVKRVNSFLIAYLTTPTNPMSQNILTTAEYSRNAKQLFDLIKKSNAEVGNDMSQIKEAVETSLKELDHLLKDIS